MSIDPNLLIALSIIRDECWRKSSCRECPLQDNCINPDNLMPRRWTIPEPPPEPTERQRIEWLRMLPDMEMLNVMDYSHFSLECADCYNSDSEGECLRKSDVEYCNAGHMEWWHEVVSLEQFRNDVGMDER